MKISDIDKLNADKFKNAADHGYICVMCEDSDLYLQFKFYPLLSMLFQV